MRVVKTPNSWLFNVYLYQSFLSSLSRRGNGPRIRGALQRSHFTTARRCNAIKCICNFPTSRHLHVPPFPSPTPMATSSSQLQHIHGASAAHDLEDLCHKMPFLEVR